MRCMLIPLDGSALAEAVIPTALALARKLDARIVLVSIVMLVPTSWGSIARGWGPVGTRDTAMPPLEEQTRATEANLDSVRRQTGFDQGRMATDAHVGTRREAFWRRRKGTWRRPHRHVDPRTRRAWPPGDGQRDRYGHPPRHRAGSGGAPAAHRLVPGSRSPYVKELHNG